MNLTFRMHEESDIDGLIRLWSEETGWDGITREIWEHRFVYTPFGKASIAVAADESGTIVGQLVFIPFMLWVNGKEVLSYRPFAAFMIEKARKFQMMNPFNHPMLKMYRMGAEKFREEGAELICMMPDPHWGRALRFLPDWVTEKYPLRGFDLPLAKKFNLADGYEVCEMAPNDPRLDDLWIRSRDFLGNSFVKNSKALTWRTSHFNFRFTGILKDNQLVAFASARPKMRDKQWLICDVVATDENAMKAVILASCNQADDYSSQHPEETIGRVSILANKRILPIVEEAGFYVEKYNFLLVVQRLNTEFSEEQLHLQDWHLGGND